MDQALGCRSCGSTLLAPVATQALGPVATSPKHPSSLVGNFAGSERIVFCATCTLVQRVAEERSEPGGVEPASPSERSQWGRQLASQVIAMQKLRPTSLVLHVGSREGHLLKQYQAADIPVLGIEPNHRLAELARLENGVPTWCRRFDRLLADDLQGCDQPADVIHVQQLLEGVIGLDGLVAGLPVALKEQGVVVIDVPYVKHLVDRGELGAPHRRAWSYFSLTSLTRLLARHGLAVYDVEPDGREEHLLLFVGKRGAAAPRVKDLLAAESAWGVDRADTYQAPTQSVGPTRPAKVA